MRTKPATSRRTGGRGESRGRWGSAGGASRVAAAEVGLVEVVASIPKLRPSGEKGLGTKGSQQFARFWGQRAQYSGSFPLLS